MSAENQVEIDAPADSEVTEKLELQGMPAPLDFERSV